MAHWKLAFVTGGSSGIGYRMTELLLTEGTSVAVFDRSNDDSKKAALQEIAARHGSRCEFFRMDVAAATQVESAVAMAVDQVGSPDMALNCAGVQNAKPFGDLSADEFDTVIRINLIGSRNFAAAVLPHLPDGGQLALMASLAGLVTNHCYTAYNASKFGVVGLAGALRLECVERNIDVSVICPPEVTTPMIVEEHKTLAPAGAKLKETAGTLQLEPACDYILKKLKQRRYMIIPGFRARRVAALTRWLPNILRTVSERIVRSTTAALR